MKFGEISGSLTHLNDGTSYLIAGTNIDIVSESWGAVTISSTAGGGTTPANPDESVQFNDGGSFGGSANFTFSDTAPVRLHLTGAFAQGVSTFVIGQYSHAEGNTTIAEGLGTHTEGNLTLAQRDYAHAEGQQTVAWAVASHAEGLGTIASGSHQHVQGKYNKRDNTFSLMVVGNGTGDDNVDRSDVVRVNPGIIGDGRVEVTGSLAATMGLSGSLTKLVDGTSYLIAGTNVTISSQSNGAVTISATGGGGGSPSSPNESIQYNDGGSFGGDANFTFDKVGYRVHLTGSMSQGTSTIASDGYSHSEGSGTEASGTASHAEGLDSTSSGPYSHAEGESTTASGLATHAEGYQTTASNDYAHAEGESTTASGLASHAEGKSTTASGTHSHAEGTLSIASGDYSHAEGVGTQAVEQGSHTEGFGTISYGVYSHAEGAYSIASGSFSHAEGEYTIASGSAQTVCGKYNERNNDFSLFVVGNGTGDLNANRKDVLRVNPGVANIGRVEVTGSLVVTKYYAGDSETLTSAGAVDEKLHLTMFNTVGPQKVFTLADGDNIGQLKYFIDLSAFGTGASNKLIPATTLGGWSYIVFTMQNETATLMWTPQGWAILSVYGATVT